MLSAWILASSSAQQATKTPKGKGNRKQEKREGSRAGQTRIPRKNRANSPQRFCDSGRRPGDRSSRSPEPSPLPAAHLSFFGQPVQQLAARAFFDPGGGRNVSDCHFLLSLPERLKIAPSA